MLHAALRLRPTTALLTLCPNCAHTLFKSSSNHVFPFINRFGGSGANSPAVERHDSNQLAGELITWKDVEKLSPSNLSLYYLRLSKFRLTSLVVATTLAGFAMGSPTWSFDGPVLAATLIGTALTSASAASLNQFLEVPYDSQMARTRSRPLVMGQLSPLHAFTFAACTGITGLSILSLGTNGLTAALGAANLVLYSFIYTPMKRMNIANTWIGSCVGAIPPVMGFTAATGSITTSGLLLGAILYSWQFPHFNALSWNLRHDYARAGYRMMSVTEPALCLRTQFRHSILLTSYCFLLSHPVIGLTTWEFAADTLPFNLYLIFLSYRFKQDPGSASSRKLFRYSLLHLPIIILLMIICKYSKSEQESKNGLEEEQDLLQSSINISDS